jgi:hypothetical protein
VLVAISINILYQQTLSPTCISLITPLASLACPYTGFRAMFANHAARKDIFLSECDQITDGAICKPRGATVPSSVPWIREISEDSFLGNNSMRTNLLASPSPCRTARQFGGKPLTCIRGVPGVYIMGQRPRVRLQIQLENKSNTTI